MLLQLTNYVFILPMKCFDMTYLCLYALLLALYFAKHQKTTCDMSWTFYVPSTKIWTKQRELYYVIFFSFKGSIGYLQPMKLAKNPNQFPLLRVTRKAWRHTKVNKIYFLNKLILKCSGKIKIPYVFNYVMVSLMNTEGGMLNYKQIDEILQIADTTFKWLQIATRRASLNFV